MAVALWWAWALTAWSLMQGALPPAPCLPSAASDGAVPVLQHEVDASTYTGGGPWLAAMPSAQQFPDQGCRACGSCTTSAHTPVPHMTLNLTPKWEKNKLQFVFPYHGRTIDMDYALMHMADTTPRQRLPWRGLRGSGSPNHTQKTSFDHVAHCLSHRQNPTNLCTSTKITNSSSLFSKFPK